MELVRRQFIEALAQFGLTASFGNIELALVSSPRVDPEDYLDLCSASIGTWWQWYYEGNYRKLERVLLKHVPILKWLANTISPFQRMAADLAVQAKIMQILLANSNLQFRERELYCADAVCFGALSSNRLMLALAQYWQGDTYTYCYDEPLTAIRHLNDALTTIGNESSLIRSAIYSDLSIAHAQDKDERNVKENEKLSCDYMEMARLTIPAYPELDPLHPCIGMGSSELDQFDGKALLCLAERTNNRRYAQTAYDMLKGAINKQATNNGYLGQAYIRKADAARVLGDMNGFVEDLTDGLRIASGLDRLTYARDIIGRVPPEWKQETAVQDLQKAITNAIQELQKDMSNALVVAHR